MDRVTSRVGGPRSSSDVSRCSEKGLWYQAFFRVHGRDTAGSTRGETHGSAAALRHTCRRVGCEEASRCPGGAQSGWFNLVVLWLGLGLVARARFLFPALCLFVSLLSFMGPLESPTSRSPPHEGVWALWTRWASSQPHFAVSRESAGVHSRTERPEHGCRP